jgi:hypothetical protein
MIVVRDIFRLKFGQSKEAIALWKQALAVVQKSEFGKYPTRLLTDLAGPEYYTLVLESTFDSVAQWDQASTTLRADPAWRSIYAKILPLTETGRREILSVV